MCYFVFTKVNAHNAELWAVISGLNFADKYLSLLEYELPKHIIVYTDNIRVLKKIKNYLKENKTTFEETPLGFIAKIKASLQEKDADIQFKKIKSHCGMALFCFIFLFLFIFVFSCFVFIFCLFLCCFRELYKKNIVCFLFFSSKISTKTPICL